MIRLYSFILFLFLSVSVFAQIDNPVFIRAEVAFENHEYERAVKLYTNLIKSNINKQEAYVKRGRCYLQNGLFDYAINDFMQAEKNNENSASYYISICYASKNDMKKSFFWLEKYLEGKHKLPMSEVKKNPGFKNISETNEWNELWKKDWYSKTETALSFAEYLYKQGNNREALDELDNLLEKRPSLDEAYFLRAKIYNALKQNKLAIGDCDLAIKYAKKNIEYYKFRAKNYIAEMKYHKALEDLNLALKIDNNKIELYKIRGIVYYHLEEFEKAEKDLRLYLSFVENDVDALYYRGLNDYKNENYLNALLSFNKLLELNPSDLKSFIARGDTYLRTKTYKYADRDYSMALDIDPQNAKTYYKRALARKALNEKEQACLDFKKAMSLGNFKAEELYYKYCK
ncbi:MAG: tetratricopeptide repeat protein [Chlorobi bacterium]|nr:tetratricopeptide repeat protein [Chlorobiota bacterium]